MESTIQNGSNNCSFVSEKYPEKLLARICQLRSQNDFCDIKLEADGTLFPAHKIILASASTYCKMLFADSKVCDIIRLKDVSSTGLKNVLDFIYSNKLSLSIANIEDTLKAAEVLLVREAIKLCFQFLEDGLNQNKCLEILNIIKKHGAEKLKEKAMKCVGQHYKHILDNPKELHELDKTTLCEILDRMDIPEYSELELFNYVVAWLNHEPSRFKEAGDLLKRIRFPLISLEDLQRHVKEKTVMKTDSNCFRYLQDALSYHSQLYTQPALNWESTSIRSSSEKLVVLGGRTLDNQVCGRIWVGDQGGSSWSDLGELCTPVYNHCVAVINGFLFVLGGQTKYDPTGKHPSNEVFRFDPRNGSWLQVAGMLERRTRFHTEVISDHIIAVGGGTLLGSLTNTVEEYNPSENNWELTAPFPVSVADHAGTTHKGILYISGGYSTGKTLRDVYSYLPRLRRWVVNRAMTFSRCDHGMATIGDKIFSIGGRTLNESNQWVHVNETEYYCPATDQWSTLTLSPFDCCQFSIISHQSMLYIIGGGSLRRMSKEDGVFLYNPEAKTWRKAGSLPQPLVDHASCTIKLPHHMVGQQPRKEEEIHSGSNKKKSTLKLFITGKQE
ncbi:kelch-like protein 9 [Bombina bombina]|uniref:kelch-like protein 9 n=1 Tax=Bombina bombina TaxID=8345 RepID=UPI00235B0A8B|nr:kelch-like protein 9 [Bombina bombina]